MHQHHNGNQKSIWRSNWLYTKISPLHIANATVEGKLELSEMSSFRKGCCVVIEGGRGRSHNFKSSSPQILLTYPDGQCGRSFLCGLV